MNENVTERYTTVTDRVSQLQNVAVQNNYNSMGARFGAVRLRKLICFGQFSLPAYAHCTGITEKTNF